MIDYAVRLDEVASEGESKMAIVRLLIVALLLLHGSGARAADEGTVPAEVRADIVRLLELTDGLAMGRQLSAMFSTQLASALKQARPDIPQRILDLMPEVVDSVIVANEASLVDGIVILYAKHFTSAELRELIRFYETDVGRKTIRVMPALMQDSMALGQAWGRNLAPAIDAEVRRRLTEEGVAI